MMAAVSIKLKDPQRVLKRLNVLVRKVGENRVLKVGFLENATYPRKKGSKKVLHVSQVAFWNEFGTTQNRARPFFRYMIANSSPFWGQDLTKIMKATNYDGKRSLSLLGERIKDQLVRSIVDWPADNAPSTVAHKGFNKGLVDKGIMQRAVDSEVVTK